MAEGDLDAAIDESHKALRDIANGDPGRYLRLYSDQADVTLGNPFGPFVTGKVAVGEAASRAAANYRNGELLGFERVATHVADGLACIAEVERFRTHVGGSETSSAVSLRVTSVYRQEEGRWRLVHRHADPITTARSAETVIAAAQ